MADFTLSGLRVVREAVRLGSFSRVADRLGYTQSAVSRQVALMEQAAGQPLFAREPRGVRPTEAGRLVARHAEAVLDELRAARHSLGGLGEGEPDRLRVGAFSTAMAALVPRAIAAIAGRRPRTRVRLREGLSPALLASVARGRLDLAVVTPPGQSPDDVELTPLLDDPLFVATGEGHPFAGQATVAPAMLRDERWIAGSTDPGSTLLGAWAEPGWRPEVAFVARDWMAKLGLVAAGLGVTTVPGLAVPALPREIAVSRIDHPAAVRATAVARRPGDRDGGHGALVEALLDAAADLSAEARHRVRHAASR